MQTHTPGHGTPADNTDKLLLQIAEATTKTAQATMVLAWIAVVVTVISLVAGIVIGVQVAKTASELGNSSSSSNSSSNCLSQGGSNPSC